MLAALVPVAVAVFCLFHASRMFDRLIQIEYSEHRGAWETDGQPTGFFWRPPGSSWIRGAFAKERLSVLWLFVTPVWARHSRSARHMLHDMRVAVLGWMVVMTATFYAIAPLG